MQVIPKLTTELLITWVGFIQTADCSFLNFCRLKVLYSIIPNQVELEIPTSVSWGILEEER